MVDEPKKSTDDEKSTDTTAIVKPEESTKKLRLLICLKAFQLKRKR